MTNPFVLLGNYAEKNFPPVNSVASGNDPLTLPNRIGILRASCLVLCHVACLTCTILHMNTWLKMISQSRSFKVLNIHTEISSSNEKVHFIQEVPPKAFKIQAFSEATMPHKGNSFSSIHLIIIEVQNMLPSSKLSHSVVSVEWKYFWWVEDK